MSVTNLTSLLNITSSTCHHKLNKCDVTQSLHQSVSHPNIRNSMSVTNSTSLLNITISTSHLNITNSISVTNWTSHQDIKHPTSHLNTSHTQIDECHELNEPPRFHAYNQSSQYFSRASSCISHPNIKKSMSVTNSTSHPDITHSKSHLNTPHTLTNECHELNDSYRDVSRTQWLMQELTREWYWDDSLCAGMSRTQWLIQRPVTNSMTHTGISTWGAS